ncbi:hypothetical protein B0I35DRAFT_415207 [Stachybotrys elegans]|uniref:Uncharacterized protein n=1 Tax=Stachybotrys elegans TaxID=80388 RepID=A0A8K0SGV9_9HYPO|nr:hypothetical protein B0I35DRAFT_415207 [Stachybotrys elegans]
MDPQPYITLIGPDKHGIIARLDPATGTRHPVIAAQINNSSKPQIKLARMLPNNLQQPFATASYSSLSGSLRVNVEGLPEIKLEQSWEGMQYAKEFKAPPELGGTGGKMAWKPAGWGDVNELWDAQGTKVARFKSMRLKNDPQLDVFVQASDAFVDVVLLAALGLLVEGGKSLKFLGDMVGAVAG